jgi:hypothetical protein
VAADTTLEVAITLIKPTPDATLNGRPSAALRNGTRKTPPPTPSSAPSVPARAPTPITTRAIAAVMSKLVTMSEVL